MNVDMNVDEEVRAALDMVYARPDVPGDVPVSNVRPMRRRYVVATGIAAALVLILAYPAVTSIGTAIGSRSHQASSGQQPANARLVTSLASLRPVKIDAPHTPRIQSVVYNHQRVTAWVASVRRSGSYVYDLGSAQLTDFTAVLPKSDSGLTDPCSFTVQFGGGESRTFQTQPSASVPVNLSGSGAMTISVTRTQPTGGVADCAMTDPLLHPVPGGTVASATPEPATSQGLSSPPVQPTQQQAQPVTSPSASTPAGAPATPSGSATPAQTGSPAPADSSTATVAPTPTVTAPPAVPPAAPPAVPPTEPEVQPEGGD
jgi:hypothetical protein